MGECRTKWCGELLANGAMSSRQVVLYVRSVPKCLERQGNPDLMGGSVELCLREGLLGVLPKSHNVSH